MRWNMRRVVGVCGLILVCAACLAISVGAYAVYGQHNLDSDISSEFVLAQLLNEEGRVFLTDSWFHSTELRVVSPVPVYQLALSLFSDWHMARTVSIAVLLVGVMLSMIYMLRGVGAPMCSAMLCAAAVILPITEYNSFTLVYGGFYTVCVMLTFVEIGLVARLGNSRGIRCLLQVLLLTVLSVYGGLNGVRMMMICNVPLLLACLITFFLEARSCDSTKMALSKVSFRMLLAAFLCMAAAYAGYRINTDVFALTYDFQQYGETMIRPMTANMFTDQIMSLMRFFGYRNDAMLLSMEGIVSVFAVVLPIAGLAAIIVLLSMKLEQRERMLGVFILTALLLGILLNVLTLEKADLPYTVSYYMPAAILIVYALFWVFDRFECRLAWLRTLPMLVLVGMFLMGNAVYRDKEFQTYNTELEEIADCLLDEAAYEGYATFWNANVLTEIASGELEAFSVVDWETGTINEWLQRKDHLDRIPWGRVFAVYRTQDWKEGEPGYDSERLVYSSNSFYVVVYDSDEEYRQAIGW